MPSTGNDIPSHTPAALGELDESELVLLAEIVAFLARQGDVLGLSGELGAGKSTFARGFVRAALSNLQEDVPSPTYTLVQTYEGPRYAIAHFDLYRLGGPDDLEELGFEALLEDGVAIVEWPERAGAALGPGTVNIALEDAAAGARRSVEISGGALGKRLAQVWSVLGETGWRHACAGVRYLQGDASARRYGRLIAKAMQSVGPASALVMDWPPQPDGPPIREGKPYSRIAHLAERAEPFLAVGAQLASMGLSAPHIYAADAGAGILVLEDLGDTAFARALERGVPQADLWSLAIDVLVELRCVDPARLDGDYLPPDYDRDALNIETELLVDWAVPAIHDRPATEAERGDFAAAWEPLISRLLAEPKTLVLRDYHSPNLLHLTDRTGTARVGLIDFQDAVLGPAAYDVVSLCQDARLDVSPELEAELVARYCALVKPRDPGFDEAAFRATYAIVGAQRNTKILGIFARLAKRDRKPQYLTHAPRIWGYLERNLAHPDLAGLRAWYDRVVPTELRGRLANTDRA